MYNLFNVCIQHFLLVAVFDWYMAQTLKNILKGQIIISTPGLLKYMQTLLNHVTFQTGGKFEWMKY